MRVIRILTRPNTGGPTMQAASLFLAHRDLAIATMLVVGRCRPGEAALDLEALGVPRLRPEAVTPTASGFVEVPLLGNRWSPAVAFGLPRQLRRLIAAFAPDVVHTHTTMAGFYGRRAARAAGVPVVAHTFHGHVLRDYFGRLPSWGLARLERHLAASSDLLFAVSGSCADELAELGVAPRARLQVVPPAVPLPALLPRAAARAELGLDDSVPAAACLGRLVPIKRVDRFLGALAAMPEWVGHVHGDGPLQRELAAAAPANVRLLASSPRARQLLAAYDALVIPSRREGCPLVAVEAFAAGVPVIGFDVPGVRDALADWGRGVLVDEREGPLGLARALRELRAAPATRSACIAAGLAAGNRFLPAAVAGLLGEAYGRALRARRG